MFISQNQKQLINGGAFGHCDPRSMLVKAGIVDAQHVDVLMTEYSADALAEKWRRLQAGLTIGDAAPGKPSGWTDSDRKRAAAEHKQAAADEQRRRKWARFKATHDPHGDAARRQRVENNRKRAGLEPSVKVSRDVYSTAIHESAHALVANHYGCPFSIVSVMADETTAGRLTWGARLIPEDDKVFFRIAIAGQIAEYFWAGKPWNIDELQLQSGVGGTGDYNMARRTGLLGTGESALACRQVEQLVKQHWPTVLTIAQRLLDCGTLAGIEVAELIRKTEARR